MDNKRTLGASLDILRNDLAELSDDIGDLYDFEKKDYLMIQKLSKELQNLRARTNRRHLRTILAFLGIGGIIYMAANYTDDLRKQIAELRLEVENLKKEKNEESDG